MNRWSALALLLILAGALALRLPNLDIRPLHNDEGVNAVKLAALWSEGKYAYDPHEFHGPTLPYFSIPFLPLGGAGTVDEITPTTLRLTTVAFGVGLILLLLLLLDGLGRSAVVISAVFIAISPAMVFYSRYYIHEMLLVFFTLLTMGSGWRYLCTGKKIWAVITGAGVAFMFATKETFVFSIAAVFVAAVATVLWNQFRAERAVTAETGAGIFTQTRRALFESWRWKDVVLAAFAGFAVWLLLFSSFFSNWEGLLDSFRTYVPWIKRAQGESPHLNPWHFYFERLAWFHPPNQPVWTELLILVLAVIGGAVALFGKKLPSANVSFVRFLVFYTVSLTAIYTVIPYKTPWCLLNFYLGMLLLAGVGVVALIQLARARTAKIVLSSLLLIGAAHLAWQAKLTSQEYAADRNNPYGYVQTTPHLLKLIERVDGIAKVAPTGHQTVVKVISPESYWPLPWYFHRFKNIGWWDELPADPYAPVIIVSSTLDARLDEKSNKAYLMTGIYEIRPKVFLELYVELELWKRFVETLPRETD